MNRIKNYLEVAHPRSGATLVESRCSQTCVAYLHCRPSLRVHTYLICLVRLPGWLNPFWHTLHAYGFSPVWVRTWAFRSEGPGNILSQCSHAYFLALLGLLGRPSTIGQRLHLKIARKKGTQFSWTTVKPVLSGHPLLSGQKPKSQNLFPLFTLNETFIKRTPLLSGRGHLKSTWNSHFYCCQPVLNGHL